MALEGDTAAIAAALDRGVDANARDSRGRTLLMYAALGGATEVCSLLLERGAGANEGAGGAWGSALHCASRRGKRSLVDMLLANGASVAGEQPPSRSTPKDVAATPEVRESLEEWERGTHAMQQRRHEAAYALLRSRADFPVDVALLCADYVCGDSRRRSDVARDVASPPPYRRAAIAPPAACVSAGSNEPS